LTFFSETHLFLPPHVVSQMNAATTPVFALELDSVAGLFFSRFRKDHVFFPRDSSSRVSAPLFFFLFAYVPLSFSGDGFPFFLIGVCAKIWSFCCAAYRCVGVPLPRSCVLNSLFFIQDGNLGSAFPVISFFSVAPSRIFSPSRQESVTSFLILIVLFRHQTICDACSFPFCRTQTLLLLRCLCLSLADVLAIVTIVSDPLLSYLPAPTFFLSYVDSGRLLLLPTYGRQFWSKKSLDPDFLPVVLTKELFPSSRISLFQKHRIHAPCRDRSAYQGFFRNDQSTDSRCVGHSRGRSWGASFFLPRNRGRRGNPLPCLSEIAFFFSEKMELPSPFTARTERTTSVVCVFICGCPLLFFPSKGECRLPHSTPELGFWRRGLASFNVQQPGCGCFFFSSETFPFLQLEWPPPSLPPKSPPFLGTNSYPRLSKFSFYEQSPPRSAPLLHFRCSVQSSFFFFERMGGTAGLSAVRLTESFSGDKIRHPPFGGTESFGDAVFPLRPTIDIVIPPPPSLSR